MYTDSDVSRILETIHSVSPRVGTTRLITIDGPAGSGKTTLAADLSKLLNDAPIVHLDDLYEGWYQDLHSDLAVRIEDQILSPIRAGFPARYQRFDWVANRFVEWLDVPAHNFLILEGVGSGHALIRSASSVVVWIESDSVVGRQRVISRDGDSVAAHIVGWQERERVFFDAYGVKESADFRLVSD